MKEDSSTREETVVVDQEGERSLDKWKIPWQTRVHTESLEEERPSQIKKMIAQKVNENSKAKSKICYCGIN